MQCIYSPYNAGISSHSHVNRASINLTNAYYTAQSFTLRAIFKGGLNSLLWVWPIGMAKTKATIVALVATAVRFLADTSPLQLAKVLESPDLAVFVSTTTTMTTTDGQTDYFTPCACARDNNNNNCKRSMNSRSPQCYMYIARTLMQQLQPSLHHNQWIYYRHSVYV